MHLREQPKPAKHVTFDPTGSFVTVSCSDGIVYLYSLSTEEPELIRKIDGVIRRLETDDEATSRAVWHPDGRAFAAATGTRDIVVVSKDDGERQRSFSGGHNGDITALAWSPNDAMLASAGADGKIVLWETKTQQAIARLVKLVQVKLQCTHSGQIRLSKCAQSCVASNRQYALFYQFRRRTLYISRFHSRGARPSAREDSSASPFHP